MINDRRVVVIGSGPAGAIAAQELVRNRIPVTMLESGSGFKPGLLLRLAGRNLYRRTPPLYQQQGHRVSGDPRTRWYANAALGGLSNNWTGAVPRFAPEDFTEGERLHERYRWPVTYSDLEPYYAKVERRLAITADTRDVPHMPAGHVSYPRPIPQDWQAVERVANCYGQGFTTMPLADGPPSLLVRRGTAFNSYVNLVQPLLNSSCFELLTGAHALYLTWNAVKGKVDGVVYYDRPSGETKCLAAEAVVIACGALSSTKLLFDSVSADFPEGLGNSEGLLGRFLHDHPREWWTFEMDHPLTLLSPTAYMTRLPYASSPPLMATSWTLGPVGVKDRVRSRFGVKGNTVGVQVFGTMIPSETCFAIPSVQKKDEFGLPRLELCIRFSNSTVDNMVRARQHLMNVMDEAGCHATIRESDSSLVPGTSAHYGGSARMHAKPQYGVVDSWNRVHRAPNVLVCDAGCFTTAVEKNPTLTVMALALRAAARLSHDLKHS
jgi:choline dehydrogenase-like flavoprotein